MKFSTLSRLFLPGLVFQSTMIGGGYATGRELVEFFLQQGPITGLIALFVATLVLSIVCGIAFEFARVFSCYDYRNFFSKLLGPSWIVFEVTYLGIMLLVLSVIGAGAGEMTAATVGGSQIWGTLVLMAVAGVMVFIGSKAIEKALSMWSIVLYVTYAVLITYSLSRYGNQILDNIILQDTAGNGQLNRFSDAFIGGITYAGYNLAAVTAVFFTVRHLHSRKEALWAGILSGPIAMIPGFLLFVAMLAHYPEITSQALPMNYLLASLQLPVLGVIVQLVIFGTFIETATALLHSVNERINTSYHNHNKNMPSFLRPIVACLFLISAVYLADGVGIIDLIGKGYLYSTYVMLAIFALPLLTRGCWLLFFPSASMGITKKI